ncbi:unnamed protein product [Chilo suppressalis]|uniref:Diapause hormone receptor n=1 Tax=Chilo suppressalis TaxID=168631 RepID=A0A0S1YDN7_CHISP|nr:diapause hormone receptor [Chilo suppressalis]CAH0407059.1 unnamed protein product [Chilo suppressalis]
MSDMSNITQNVSTTADPTRIFGPHRDPLYIVLPITIIYSVIFVTGLIGNMLTCLVIIRNKSMQTATNYYLFSLAISDLLLLVSGMPQEIYSIWSKWPYVFGPAFCLLRGLASETSTNASVLTITLFTVERYLAICHPFVSHKMSKLSRATKHVFILWVISLALALPQALQFGIGNFSGVTMCLQTRVIIQHSFEISTFLFFFTPMILITVLYALIGVKLKQTRINKEVQDPELFEKGLCCPHSNKIRKRPNKSTRRVVKMLVAVVVAFFVCWAPFHAQRLVAIYGTTAMHQARQPIMAKIYNFLTYISGVFYYLSSCINPILYQIMSNKFREAFKHTFKQCCCGFIKEADTRQCLYNAVTRSQTSNGKDNSMKKCDSNHLSERKQSDRDTKSSLDSRYLICDACKKINKQHSTDKTNGNNNRTDHGLACSKQHSEEFNSIPPATPCHIFT